MRIQGRSPNDDPATFQIKFAGSFAPGEVIAETESPKMPEVRRETNSDVIVNSVRNDHRHQTETDTST